MTEKVEKSILQNLAALSPTPILAMSLSSPPVFILHSRVHQLDTFLNFVLSQVNQGSGY